MVARSSKRCAAFLLTIFIFLTCSSTWERELKATQHIFASTEWILLVVYRREVPLLMERQPGKDRDEATGPSQR